MNDVEKINFLINSCQKHHQRFPHTLVVNEDFSACEAFALDISSKLARDMVTVNAAMIYKVGDLAGIVTNLKENDFLLIEDVNLFNKECLYYFSGILEDFRLDLMIDSGPSARSVEVKLHEFTVIGSVTKVHLMPRKLLSSFFCIIEGEETRKVSVEAIHKILNGESIITSKEVSEYIFSLTDSNKIEIKYFLKNLVRFFGLSGFQKNYVLTCNMIDEYFNFFGISNFKKESTPSRQILIDVQREVWRRDQGRCVMCQSQEYLELDHIIPFSKGGSNTARNIQLLCESCNRQKGAKI
jgi:Holliday junction resolvasome RuvABC ATP-dependent DNA helicase subunit